jgi:hypothetical protein
MHKLESVFISPEMSPDERARHKELVLDLKRKIAEQAAKPNLRNFIRRGEIVTENKT